MKSNNEIAAALRAAKWVDEPIGNKALVLAACQALEKTPSPERVIAYRVLTADGKPWTDWISGCPAEGEKPLLPEGTELAEGSFELAYSGPTGLTVWEGTMPESNGKTNYTAILHKGDITEGMTIARSEYPDRVRYEADLVRWLIGERAERPWITDYDDQKHSGYVPPAKPEQQPVGQVEVMKDPSNGATSHTGVLYATAILAGNVEHGAKLYADPDNIPGALQKCMQAMADRDAHAKKVEQYQAIALKALEKLSDVSKINDEMQSFAPEASKVWHRHEDIDDVLHEVSALLEGMDVLLPLQVKKEPDHE